MKQKTIDNFKAHLVAQIESKSSRQAYEQISGLSQGYFNQKMNTIKRDSNISSETFEEISDLWNQSNNCSDIGRAKASAENGDDEYGVTTNLVRGNDGKIEKYEFDIKIKNKLPLKGEFSRDAMNMIYELYSSYGARITQKDVSRRFPKFTLIDFKRILRAFNITKASAPFAPHMLEEHTEKELEEIAGRIKENNVLVSIESNQVKKNEVLVRKQLEEIHRLRTEKSKIEDIVEKFFGVNIEEPKVKGISVSGDQTIVIHLADLHVGAKVSPNSQFPNEFNLDILRSRLNNLLSELVEFKSYNIVVNLLGDLLDGMDNQTSRRDHFMPQNMNNLEQVNNFLILMDEFFVGLKSIFTPEKIRVYSVNCGNHDGITGYTATKALFYKLQFAYNINCELFEQFFGTYTIGDDSYVITHGKDDLFCKRGMPMNLDDRTKNMIYEWLDEYNIRNKRIHFVKGDLHNDNVNSCHKFDYRNTLSLFGASDYAMNNFGRTSMGVSFDIIDKNNFYRGNFINL